MEWNVHWDTLSLGSSWAVQWVCTCARVHEKKYLWGVPVYSIGRPIARPPEWLEEFTDNLEDTEVPALTNTSQDSDSERPTKVASRKQSICTNFPKDRNCEVCKRTQITRAPCRKRNGEAVPRAAKIWWLDHSRSQSPQWRRWISNQSPIRSRGKRFGPSMDSILSVQNKNFSGDGKEGYESSSSRRGNQKSFFSGNSLQFGNSCEDLSWNHCTSTPHRSETNGTAERSVRRIKEGTSAELLLSGFDEKWWADSVECYCYLRDVQDLLADGKTPYESRFGEPFKGPVILFGAMFEYHPISAKDQSKLHHFDKKVLPGIFLGFVLFAESVWKRDIMVADIEEPENLEASEIHVRRDGMRWDAPVRAVSTPVNIQHLSNNTQHSLNSRYLPLKELHMPQCQMLFFLFSAVYPWRCALCKTPCASGFAQTFIHKCPDSALLRQQGGKYDAEQRKRNNNAKKGWTLYIPNGRWNIKQCLGEIMESENPL